jgi:alpha-galactosidase
MISRRSFLGKTLATSALAITGTDLGAMSGTTNRVRRGTNFVELLRVPDSATAFAGVQTRLVLDRSGSNFATHDVAVHIDQQATELSVRLTAPTTSLTHLHLRWLARNDPTLICLGDHWERSYGDLAWRGMEPERVMPWYFATHDGSHVHAYGVKVGAAALCFWQIDPEGVSLWLDVSNGGDGVLLGGRQLDVATIVTRRGTAGESPMATLRAFCRQMSPAPRPSKGPVYGVNDWYFAYGNNNQQMLLGMADLVAGLAPSGVTRPYAVVDMGWKDGSAAFPSMADFATEVKKRGVRPGIWIRPLEAINDANAKLLLPAKRFGQRTERSRELAFDPTIPEALALVTQKIKYLADWKFELVKHDFSTYDLLGQWGFEMGAQPTLPGWHFNDRGRTNAEIILDFYKTLRGALGEKLSILGCNTIGHLGAGIFELQRTGDDTSGKIWERTRRMGVNTLAYRLPQHGTFFHLDADCVGITKLVPWSMTRQWLDLVARSKTALFISPEEGQVGPEQRAALREAFAIVTSGTAAAEPADFLHDTTPEDWKTNDRMKQYQWCGAEGGFPFTV